MKRNFLVMMIFCLISYPAWAIFIVKPTKLGQIGISVKNNLACFYSGNQTFISYLTISSNYKEYEFYWNFATHDLKKTGHQEGDCIGARVLNLNTPYRVRIQNDDGKKYLDSFCIQKKANQLFISETVINQENGMNIGCSDKAFVIKPESELPEYGAKPKQDNKQSKMGFLEGLWRWLFN